MSNSGLFHREIGSAVMARDGEEDTDCSAASIPVWGEQQQMQKYQHSAEEEGATPDHSQKQYVRPDEAVGHRCQKRRGQYHRYGWSTINGRKKRKKQQQAKRAHSVRGFVVGHLLLAMLIGTTSANLQRFTFPPSRRVLLMEGMYDRYSAKEFSCAVCPAGFQYKKACTRFTQQSCQPCPLGYVQPNVTINEKCVLCRESSTACPQGYIYRNCTATRHGGCEKSICQDGYYGLDLSHTIPNHCRPCSVECSVDGRWEMVPCLYTDRQCSYRKLPILAMPDIVPTPKLTAEATTPTQVSSNHAHTKIATSSQGTTRPREIPTRPRASTTPIRTTATRPTTTEPGNKARDWFIHRPSFNDSSRGSGNGTVYTKAERELTKRNALLYQLVIGSLSVVAIVQGTCLVITRCNKRGGRIIESAASSRTSVRFHSPPVGAASAGVQSVSIGIEPEDLSVRDAGRLICQPVNQSSGDFTTVHFADGRDLLGKNWNTADPEGDTLVTCPYECGQNLPPSSKSLDHRQGTATHESTEGIGCALLHDGQTTHPSPPQAQTPTAQSQQGDTHSTETGDGDCRESAV